MNYLDMIDDVREEQKDLKAELIERQMNRIRERRKEGKVRWAHWCGCEEKYKTVQDEVMRMFESKGYKIVNNGTIDIYW